jgi:hypothetical protein
MGVSMLKRRQLAAAAILVSAALGACDESLSDLAGPTPNLQPTFTSIQREIFESTDQAGRTACVTCHTGANPFTTLNLREGVSYNGLVNAPSRQKPGATIVIPGDPENSYLVHKLEGRSGIVGERMPRNQGPFLTSGQMLIIRRWIELGAPNN